MDKSTLIAVHTRPVGDMGLFVVVVALAHPQEVRGECHRRAIRSADRLDGPEVGLAVS